MPDLILDRFAPIDQAGAGGFAKVIHAYDTELTREVAIKIIPLESDSSAVGDGLGAEAATGIAAGAHAGSDAGAYEGAGNSSEGDIAAAPAKPRRFGRGRSQVTRRTTGFLAAEEKFASLLGGPSHRDDTQILPPSVSLVGMDEAAGVGASGTGVQATAAYGLGDSPSDNSGLGSVPGLEEARAASTLDDPTIVKIHDFRQQGTMGYLIMEYVDGISVADLLTRCPDALDADVIATIFKSVAKALQVAHARGVLHLDIKPANVLVTPKGQVKVVDFGLARLMDESGFGSAASGGTVGYMPPEQMRQEELDQRCDEWALASLTYQLITGSNPFIVDSLDDAEDAIYGAEIFVPSAFKAGIDEAVDDIIFCALDPDRDERYDTVKAFAKELQPCLGDVKEGKQKLKRLVAAVKGRAQLDETDDLEPVQAEESYVPAEPRIPLVDMLDGRGRAILQRVLAVATTALTGLVAVGNFTPANDWTNPVTWGIFVALLFAAGVLPHVGALVVFVLLGVSIALNGGTAAGLVLILGTALWWFFQGRFSNTSANVALSTVAFGAIGGAALTPLLAGWLLRPKGALATSVQSVVVAFVLGGLGSCSITGWDAISNWQIRMWTDLNANYLSMMYDPQLLAMGAAFLLAGLVMSLCCLPGRPWLGYLGAVLATVMLVAGLLVGRLTLTGGLSFVPSTVAVMQVIIVGIVMIIVCLAGWPQKYDSDVVTAGSTSAYRGLGHEEEVPW